MATINNIAPPDDFSDASGVLRCPNSRSITVQLSNAAVYYQLAIANAGVSSAAGGEAWGNEVFMLPGYWNFDSSDFQPSGVCHGIRFRNAVAGVPAAVTANA